MMGAVVHIASEESVETAWEAYAVLARQLSTDATLIADRTFNERMARAHERWRRLFMIQDGSRSEPRTPNTAGDGHGRR